MGRGSLYTLPRGIMNHEQICAERSPDGNSSLSEAVRESEEKYRMLFEAIDEGFCIVEVLFDENQTPVDYRFLEVNPAFRKQTGLANAVGKRMRELAPEHEEHWFQIYGHVALTGNPERFENRAAALNRWYDVYAFRVGTPGQHRVGIIFRDITERRRTAEALRFSERKLRRALAIETVGVIHFKVDGAITDANDAFLRMSGYTRDDLRAGTLRWEVLTPPEWMAASRKAVNEFKTLGRTIPYEKEYLCKNGSRFWALFAATRVSEDEGVEFIIDISESKRTEHSLAQVRAELQRTNKTLETIVAERTAKLRDAIAELHQVSYSMVHDMRAPLRAMRGFAELLESMDGEHPAPESREYLRRIVLAAERLDNLITDALNYTRVLDEELPMEAVDLHHLVTGLVETYPNLHADFAKISIGELPVVLGNKSLLTQIFSNLLGNAVKFSRPGSKPEIRVWTERLCGTSYGTQCARIWVEDNGIGIPPASHERVFGIFQKFHPEYPGTGIGLAIVKKAAERIGGSVGVESEEGKGSRFWVNLQIASKPTGEGLGWG
jgi:PAS domain S-box-containing protein